WGALRKTVVLSVRPAAQSPAGGAPPCRIAEPSLAAHIDRQFPAPTDRQWKVRFTLAGGDNAPEQEATVSIDALGLSPAESALFAEESLAAALVANQGGERGRGFTPPAAYHAARAMWGAFGGQPTSGRALAATGPQDSAAINDLEKIPRTDLAGRFSALRAECTDTIAGLRNAAVDPLVSLRRAWAWGVVPASEPAPQ